MDQNNFWLEKWNSGDIPFHEQMVNTDLIAFVNELHLKKGDAIFVPLCGKTKDIVWLAEQGFKVFGVELSPVACEEFFAELKVTCEIIKLNKFTKYKYNNIELFCGDFFDLTNKDLPEIKAVYDCKALIALPPNLREKYLNQIVNCLGRKIRILLITRETNDDVTPPPFPINKEEVNLLYGAYFKVYQLKAQAVENIPERLIKKGYAAMVESVYLISES